MKHLMIAAACLAIAACQSETANTSTPTENVLELGIEGLSFVGPDTVKSGWTTVRIDNDAGMAHFGLVYRVPDHVTADMITDEIVRPLQASLTATIAGDTEEAQRQLATLPPWLGELVWMGGPGMMSDGVTAEATMYLEPGHYIVECYVKTDGFQHNYNPNPGQHGMVHAFTVTEEEGGMAEPEANVTLTLTNGGYEIADGAFAAGENSVRAIFAEQQLYNNFVGHDAHMFRIDPDTDVDVAANWVDFFPVEGQQTPAPAHFVGGIHDMPQGSTGYFKVTLEPGSYGITAEIPDAKANGHFMTVEVPAG